MNAAHALRFEPNTDPQVWARAGWSPVNRPLGWWGVCRCGWRSWGCYQAEIRRNDYARHKADA